MALIQKDLENFGINMSQKKFISLDMHLKIIAQRFLSSYDALVAKLIKEKSDPEWFDSGSFRLLNKIRAYDDPTELKAPGSINTKEDDLVSQNLELERILLRIESRIQRNYRYILDEEDLMLEAKLINFAGGEAFLVHWGHKVYVLDELFVDNIDKISSRTVETLEEEILPYLEIKEIRIFSE